MLYVIQIRTGSERTVINECKTKISSDILRDIYTPVYEEKYRENKVWKLRQKILFPGYVFVETDDVNELCFQLRLVTGFTRLISVDRNPISVTEDEMILIDKLTGNNHIMEISEGIIEGSVIKVLSGPLRGLEGLLTKIDRHKCRGWIETDMFGRKQLIQVGLEITKKIE